MVSGIATVYEMKQPRAEGFRRIMAFLRDRCMTGYPSRDGVGCRVAVHGRGAGKSTADRHHESTNRGS